MQLGEILSIESKILKSSNLCLAQFTQFSNQSNIFTKPSKQAQVSLNRLMVNQLRGVSKQSNANLYALSMIILKIIYQKQSIEGLQEQVKEYLYQQSTDLKKVKNNPFPHLSNLQMKKLMSEFFHLLKYAVCDEKVWYRINKTPIIIELFAIMLKCVLQQLNKIEDNDYYLKLQTKNSYRIILNFFDIPFRQIEDIFFFDEVQLFILNYNDKEFLFGQFHTNLDQLKKYNQVHRIKRMSSQRVFHFAQLEEKQILQQQDYQTPSFNVLIEEEQNKFMKKQLNPQLIQNNETQKSNMNELPIICETNQKQTIKNIKNNDKNKKNNKPNNSSNIDKNQKNSKNFLTLTNIQKIRRISTQGNILDKNKFDSKQTLEVLESTTSQKWNDLTIRPKTSMKVTSQNLEREYSEQNNSTHNVSLCTCKQRINKNQFQYHVINIKYTPIKEEVNKYNPLSTKLRNNKMPQFLKNRINEKFNKTKQCQQQLTKIKKSQYNKQNIDRIKNQKLTETYKSIKLNSTFSKKSPIKFADCAVPIFIRKYSKNNNYLAEKGKVNYLNQSLIRITGKLDQK